MNRRDLLFLCGWVATLTVACTQSSPLNGISKMDEQQFKQIIRYVKQDSMMADFAQMVEKKKPTDIQLRVAYREDFYTANILRALPKKDISLYLDIDSLTLEQRWNDSSRVTEERIAKGIRTYRINHEWTKLSTQESAPYVLFFSRYNDRLVRVLIYSRHQLYYDDFEITCMFENLGYVFYFDKTKTKILKVSVGLGHP